MKPDKKENVKTHVIWKLTITQDKIRYEDLVSRVPEDAMFWYN